MLGQLDENERCSCSSLTSGGSVLLNGKGAEAQTMPNDSVRKRGQSPEYFFTATGSFSAHLYVTPGSYICKDYHQ